MKCFLFILFVLLTANYSLSQDSLIIQTRIISDYLNVYEDSNGIKKIGEISKRGKIFLLAPGGSLYFLIHGDGLTGYSPSSFIEYNKNTARKLNHNNIEWKINEALRLSKKIKREEDSLAYRDSLENKAAQKKLLAKGLKNGLHVTEFITTGNEYKTGFEISIMNFVKKTIKYIHITVMGLNDVKDVEAKQIFRAVGPISFLNSANYSYENAFFSRVITELRISKISVEYMDGNKKEYVGPELRRTLTYLEAD